MTPTNLRLMLTVEQAGQLAGISRRHAYKLVAEGAIPSVRLGGAIRVPTAQLLEVLGALPPAAAKPHAHSVSSADGQRLARALVEPKKAAP